MILFVKLYYLNYGACINTIQLHVLHYPTEWQKPEAFSLKRESGCHLTWDKTVPFSLPFCSALELCLRSLYRHCAIMFHCIQWKHFKMFQRLHRNVLTWFYSSHFVFLVLQLIWFDVTSPDMTLINHTLRSKNLIWQVKSLYNNSYKPFFSIGPHVL